jgi:hypothetical protein
MSPKRATQRRWIVHRTFEPDRLSSTTLVQAYAHIVPYHIRVLRLSLAPEPRSAPLNDQAGPKITERVDLQSKDALVIETITKKEAC